MLRIILLSAGLTGSFLALPLIADDKFADDVVADATAASREGSQAQSGSKARVADKKPLDVWQRIRQAERIQVRDTPEVAAYRERYTREAHWISKTMHRGKSVLGMLIEKLDARGMPPELALLPAVESSYEPNAVSSGKASGLWQIIPITALEMGLDRTDWFDGRADLVTSTDAALTYLSALNKQFDGNWPLTLAAYNAGPGRVSRAIAYNRERDRPTDYWSLPLPQETRNYVPKLFSLLQMIKAEATAESVAGLTLPDVPQQPAFVEVDAGTRISIDRAASLAGLPERELRFLNAGWIHGITAPDGPHTLYLPHDNVDRFVTALVASDKQELVSLPDTHEVIAGDSLGAIAARYRTTSGALQALNHLHGETIHVGQKLVVVAQKPMPSPVDYVVTSGDSLSAIAERYAVELDDITTASGVAPTTHIIHPGQTLKIAVPSTDQMVEAEPVIN